MALFTMRISAICAIAASLLGATPVFAHHSGAMFDWSHLATMDGTVKEFAWTNPHVVMWFYNKPQAGGEPELWTIEFNSPGNLTRIGMTRHSFNPGDHVVVELAPMRDGTHGGAFQKITQVDANPPVTFLKDSGVVSGDGADASPR